MGLQVWLPLTKDLRNQGLDNITVVNNGATFNSSGKLGGCYSFDGSNDNLSYIPSVDALETFSIALWMCPNDAVPSGVIFGLERNTYWQVELYSNTIGIRDNSIGWNGTRKNFSTGTFTANVWTHLVVTYNKGELKIYRDGTLLNTNIVGGNKLNTGINNARIGSAVQSGYYHAGKISDFRFYDHCLSPKEIKLLSQGLILHYLLTGNLPRSQYDNQIYQEPDGSLWTRIFHHNNPNGGVFASTDNFSVGVYKDTNKWYDIEGICNSISKYEFIVKQKTTSSASEVKYRWIQTKNPTQATWSDVKPASVTRITTEGYTDGTFGGIYKNGGNTRMVIANGTSSNWYGACGSWTAYQSGIPGYPNTVITTGYIDLYIRIDNLGQLVEYDYSGYCNNGTRNNINYDINSPKYNINSIFNGSNSYIKVNKNNWAVQGQEALTINVWAYSSNWPTTTKIFSCTETGGWNTESGNSGYIRFPIHVYTNSGKTSTAYKYSSNEVKISDLTAGWHMLTFVYDSSGNKIYVDGVPHSSYNFTSYGIHYNMNARLFLGCEANTANPSTPYLKGQLCDFRIYATALSESDVLSLYHNEAEIDSDGTIHGRIRS